MRITDNIMKQLGIDPKKKILVTGAAGFIGSHLYLYLKNQGHKVVGIDNFSHACSRPMPEVKYADIRYAQDIEKYVKEADLIYHLAAQIHVDKSIEHVEETLETNIRGTYNILEAVRKYGKRLIFASTSEIYGGHGGKITESSPTYSQSPYATSKLAGDKLCGNYHELYGTRVIRLRNFNTFGPWQNDGAYGSVIPIFVKKALKKEPLPIFGDGTQRRDFMYIDDCLFGYQTVTDYMTAYEGEPVNVGSGESISVNELAELVSKIVGVPHKVEHLPARAGEVSKLEADISLVSKAGYKPVIGFEEGLRRYIEWYKTEKYEK